MTNTRTKSVYYKPRYTQMEAFDMLPKPIREVLWEGAQEWDCGAILRKYKKFAKEFSEEYAISKMVDIIERWHSYEIREGKCWRNRLPGQRWNEVANSPHVQAKATMQTSGHKQGAS